MKAIYSVPFDAPVKLPPPSFLCDDGVERKGTWLDISSFTDESRILVPVMVDISNWKCWYGSNPE